MPKTDFRLYCSQLTNSQVFGVIEKETEGAKRDPDRAKDLEDAKEEARSRGLL